MRWTDGDDAGAELDADRNIVMGGEATLTKADRERGFAASRVAYADELGDVVPGI